MSPTESKLGGELAPKASDAGPRGIKVLREGWDMVILS
jgi:hypothetical protein